MPNDVTEDATTEADSDQKGWWWKGYRCGRLDFACRRMQAIIFRFKVPFLPIHVTIEHIDHGVQ